MGLQRVRHDIATEQQNTLSRTLIYNHLFHESYFHKENLFFFCYMELEIFITKCFKSKYIRAFMFYLLRCSFETTWTSTLNNNTMTTRSMVFKHFCNHGKILSSKIVQKTSMYKTEGGKFAVFENHCFIFKNYQIKINYFIVSYLLF